MILLPASDFSIEELTKAYNQTRTDYLIPMPMNPGRLQEYITLYDVDMPASRVAIIDQAIVGLGMLGARSGTGWITRLGVLPEGRRRGVGSSILQALLDEATTLDHSAVWLEVISGNIPAHELFLKYNFTETRELIVARRSPITARNMSAVKDARKVRYLQHDEVVDLHCQRRQRMNWLNSVETMRNVRRLANTPLTDGPEYPQHELAHLSGIFVEFQNGSQGWVTYQATTLQLKRISVEVISGEPARTTSVLLELLHRLHSSQDAVIENIPDDECWTGYKQAGYFEVFRRIEMVRESAKL
jgi:ribosomal protein S18 acetylase RimI-like enzyme